MELFITLLQSDPLYYASWVITCIISICLHELAHGWVAIWRGDRTPIELDRMTPNPLVQMGPFSLIALFVTGMAWGAMPIDPTRMRGRFAEAMVAAAGPAMNLLLAVFGLTALAIWKHYDPAPAVLKFQRGQEAVWVFGVANLALCMFNLCPAPPLDGSHILANLDRRYARLIYDPDRQGLGVFLFMAVFLFSPVFFGWAAQLASWYVHLLL